MAVVLDASVLVVLASGDPRRPKAQAHVQAWIESNEPLHAPVLLSYEVASGLTHLIAAGAFPRERLPEAWRTILDVPVTFHPMEQGGERVVTIALQLRRQSAYDAAYLALAEELEAELWTFDGPLAHNATSIGFQVHLVE